MNIDKLFDAVASKGHVCVGLDTAAEYVPPLERKRAASDADAVFAYNKAIIDATFDAAACYKVQIAYYEEMGLAGLACYAKTLRCIREKGGIAIADIKRGDIAETATRYAKAHFEGDFESDFVTLSPYMGMDSIMPWISFAESRGKGAFVLMRTSNPGMRDFEFLELKGEVSPPASSPPAAGIPLPPSAGACAPATPPRRLYNAVGDKLAALAAACTGLHGYGAFGAVVGCTEREEAAEIRSHYPSLFFLVPGYGAQGGAASDAALLMREGNGGVVNASRSILKAWTKKCSETDSADNAFAAQAALEETVKMRDALREEARRQR